MTARAHAAKTPPRRQQCRKASARISSCYTLPDQDETKWPFGNRGDRVDPWQETHSLVLKDIADDSLLTWTITSWYGIQAIGHLLAAYQSGFKQHIGAMPVVVLSSRDQPTNHHGIIQAPTLTVVDWKAFGDGASPPGRPLPASASASVVSTKANVTTGPFRASESPKKSGNQMDDEIPF
jgi:hypothetical protein